MSLRAKPSPFFPQPSSSPSSSSSGQMGTAQISEADARLAYRSADPTSNHTPHSLRSRKLKSPDITKREWLVLGGVVGLALLVRMWKIDEPSSVVFDEVHFGGFASKYIRRTFFMDVHPPLAKLLITFAAWLGGYKGGPDDFKDIAKEYTSDVPYVFMRSLPAIFGILLIPTSYLTLRALSCTITTSLLAALLITFENALVAQSRLILLDSPLILFTATTILFFARFANEDNVALGGKPFGKAWWRWLAMSGLSLGAVASCKWVGLFTIATVGLATVEQLWTLLGNLKVTPRVWMKHFMARAACLIVLPVMVYMFTFRIHFWVLNASGEGDGFMSSEFQHTLEGHGMADTYADVALGSTVSIRHLNTNGGYLHSHLHNYPGGSQQQQITLYPHRDTNNEWLVLNASTDGVPDPDYQKLDPMVFLTEGSHIRLQHKTTEKRLHSHDVRPPISEVDFQNEVTGYGFEGFAGDANDIFVVELSASTDRKSRKHLRALRSHFKLRHLLSGCYLFSHKVKLPDWGFEQQEVTCNKNPVLENALWYVETNEHPMLPANAEKVNYKRPSFLQKFTELQAVMWHTNAGLTDRHAYDSRPGSWPFMRRGINFWVKDNRQIYLIGNPFTWWLATTAVFSYIAVRGVLILRAKRGFRDLHHPVITHYDPKLAFLLLAWALHYTPFFLMSRQLFLHHYLPALYFSILLLAVLFDASVSKLAPRSRLLVAGVIAIGAIATYRHFSPLSYGRAWTRKECEDSKWRKTWDFSCADFHVDMSQYSTSPVNKLFGAAPSPSEAVKIEQPPAAGEAFTTSDIPAAPIEPGHDIFAKEDKAAPIYDAELAAQAALANDDLIPAKADDIQTGTSNDDAAVSRAAETTVAPVLKLEELKGEERKEAEELVEAALEHEEEEMREEEDKAVVEGVLRGDGGDDAIL